LFREIRWFLAGLEVQVDPGLQLYLHYLGFQLDLYLLAFLEFLETRVYQRTL
jgi:hypothetical protein